MKMAIKGVMAPITTPFDETTGDVDAVALRNNARSLFDAGLTGILAAGSTGEAAMLDEVEYRSIIEWLRDVVPEDRHLMAGAGRESTRGTIAACQAAGRAGADTVLIRAPAYYGAGLSDDALVDHFRAVADASPLPILLYNIPKYTHLTISDGVFRALVTHENIIGAKDSSGDLKNFIKYREAAPDWSLLVGNGTLLYAALESGGVGGILAVANFAAETAAGIAEAFDRGERNTAGALQERLTPLHKEIVGALGPAGVKAAMDVVGLHGGPVRAPLRNVGPDRTSDVQSLLARSNLIAT
jgi:4-hydroxy-2-oxoglutarate aldolase